MKLIAFIFIIIMFYFTKYGGCMYLVMWTSYHPLHLLFSSIFLILPTLSESYNFTYKIRLEELH